MTDKELLIQYFEQEIQRYRVGEPHKIFLYEEKIKNIDWWAGTKWGQDKIKEIKEANK